MDSRLFKINVVYLANLTLCFVEFFYLFIVKITELRPDRQQQPTNLLYTVYRIIH